MRIDNKISNLDSFVSRFSVWKSVQNLFHQSFQFTTIAVITISVNLLVVYRESVNLIGYVTVDYQLLVSPN